MMWGLLLCSPLELADIVKPHIIKQFGIVKIILKIVNQILIVFIVKKM
jgi:hypothetical protein